jgi:hypothetical protein
MPQSKTPFSEIKGLSQPSRNALAGAGYQYVEELAGVTERDLAKLHAMGPKALAVLRDFLDSKGLSFRIV